MADPRYPNFNNPAIGAAFADVAQLFAPVKAQDMYAGAKAAETRQKIQGLADLYRAAQNPNFDKALFDRLGMATGNWNPNASFYSVDQADATKRFGIGVESGDRRYATGVQAETARRGQDIHSRDTQRGQDIDSKDKRYNTDTVARTAITTKIMDPVGTGQVRVVPPSIADAYSVPSHQTGIVEVKPGEQQYLPDGFSVGGQSVIKGPPKPVTLDEAKGAQFQELTPAEKNAVVFSSTPLEADAKTGKPTTRPEALRSGSPVAENGNAQVFNYRSPSGKAGNAVIERGIPVDSVTRQPLEQGSQLQAPSGVQNKEGLGPTTANQTNANQKAAQLDVFDKTLDGYEALLRNNPGIVGIPGTVRGTAQNALSIVQEFGQAFGKLSPMAALTEDQVRQYATVVGAGTRDPAIAQVRVAQADLAYKWAQMQNPTGEVSRQAFERALETISGGSLPNNASALEAITAMRQVSARERQGVASLLAPGGKPTGPRVIQTPAGNVTIERVP